MPEYFHCTFTGPAVQRLSLTDDADPAEQFGFLGDPADCYCALSLSNVDGILERVRKGRTVSVCTELAIRADQLGDRTDPCPVYEQLKAVGHLSPQTGGFRRVDYADLNRLAFVSAWQANKHLLTEGLALELLRVCERDPLRNRLSAVGMGSAAGTMLVCLLLDPRRFTPPDDPADVSWYADRLGLGRDNTALHQRIGDAAGNSLEVVNDNTLDLRDRAWAVLTASWSLSPDNDGYFQQEAARVSRDEYGTAGDGEGVPYEVVERTNERAAEYLRRVWLDTVNGWHTFDPFEFFPDKQFAAAYAAAFPAGVGY